MEIKTRYGKLSIAAFVATICLLLWLLSFAGGSAQMAVGAGGPLLPTAGFEVAQCVSPTLWPDATASHEHEDESLDRKGELVGDAVLVIATPVPWPDGYESDDAQYEANRITVNDHSPQRHNFHVADDEDWVKFRAWAGNAYTIRTFDLDFLCDTVLGLYDTHGITVTVNDDEDESSRASRIDWTASDNRTCFVKVSQHDPSVGGNLWYSMTITDSVTCKDEYEPDDTWDDAKPITVNGTPQYYHKFHGPCGGDEDWVKFEAVAGNAYTIRTFNLNGGNDTTLKLYRKTSNGDLIQVAENDDDPDNIPASRIDWTARANGTYFVKVAPFMTSAGACDLWYSLSVATLASTPTPTPTPTAPPIYDPDEYEPDDASHEANRITVNGMPQDHTFHVEDDEDWVKFWAWAGNAYTIRTFDLEAGNNTTLCLYDEDGSPPPIDCSDNGPNPPASRIDWIASESGTYFVRVAPPKVGDSGYFALSSSHGLTYSVEISETYPCRDKHEPDNTWEQAERITVGNAQDHNFHVPCSNGYHLPDTADWVKFNATEGVTYTIKTSHLEGGNDTTLCLYDEYGSPLDVCNDDDPDNIPASRIVWEAPAGGGIYLVKVSPFDHRAGGCGVSYTLEVAPWIDSLDLTVSPAEVPADGVESSTLTACVKDHEGKPVVGVTVYFTATLGEPSPPYTSTNSSGCATSYLTSPDPGTAMVVASVGPVSSNEAEVDFKKYVCLPLILKPPPTPTPTPTPTNTPTPTPLPCLPTPIASTCDWCEPSNDWENRDRCGPLCSGISYEACLCCVNDPTDYYYIDMTTRNRITIALDVPNGVDYDLYLYNSLGEMVAQSDEYGKGVDEYIGYDPPATGRYYIRIYPYEGCSDSDPYTLTATYD